MKLGHRAESGPLRGLLVVATFSAVAASLFGPAGLHACTGIRLKGKDGTVVYGRTMEWGAFDLHSRVAIVPRGVEFVGQTPDGKPGLTWKGKYGIVGLDAVKKDYLVDGINEKGLAAGLFYHPGFAKYAEYDASKANDTLGPTDVAQYVLSQCATIAETREALGKVRVVPVKEPALGFSPPSHFMITEPDGKSIVIEFLDGNMVMFDNPLGVITNAPTFDWHMINLRNHINLSALALPSKKIEELDFKPLGAGSGLIGLPGDFTPPSRFVRAVAFTQTARPTEGGVDTANETFRILDNFNLPLAAVNATDEQRDETMKSSTIWTSVYDTKNRVLYYHTQHNRRVRKVDLNKIDFEALKETVRLPLDKEKSQDVEDITPKK